jgi:fucose 4-O-acetylase-like acetyltransferase
MKDWINILKGLGIIMVVYAHVDRESELARYIYWFHIPLFFFISGYLYHPTPQFILNKTQSLLLPYLTFTALIKLGDAQTPLLNLLYGGTSATGPYGVMWFVTSLFGTQILLHFLKPDPKWAIPLAYLISYILSPLALPFAIETIPMASIFYLAGQNYHEWSNRLPLVVYVLLITVMIDINLYFIPITFDLKQHAYGLPLLSPLTALAAIHILVKLSKLFDTHLLGLTGQASMVIMFLHLPIIHAMPTQPQAVQLYASLFAPLGVYLLLKRYKITKLLFLGQFKPMGATA